MKTTDFIVETSQLAQEADEMHQDHEVQMARSDCYNAAKYAIELHRMLKQISEQQGLDGWVSEKITLANDYLRTVHEYLSHEMEQGQEQEMMVFAEDAANYALDTMLSEGETGEERDASARRENERYANAANYQGRNARGDVIRSGGEVVKGNPNPPSLLQRAAGKLGLPNTATDALGKPMYKSSTPKSGGGGGGRGGMSGHLGDGGTVKSLIPNFESKNSVRESATGGASSAGGIAVSMSGGNHKPGTGKPKKIGNAAKMTKYKVGKGVY